MTLQIPQSHGTLWTDFYIYFISSIFFFEGKFYGEEKGLWDIKSGFENIPEIKRCSTNLSVLLLIT